MMTADRAATGNPKESERSTCVCMSAVAPATRRKPTRMTIRKRLVRDWPSGSRFHTKPGYSARDERYDNHRRAVNEAVMGGLQR